MKRLSKLLLSSLTRPANLQDATLVHGLYLQNPCYFETIAIEMPTLKEVKDELTIAAKDPCRYVELVVSGGQESNLRTNIIDPQTNREVLGFLDYKLDYPDKKDVTVNLLMISSRVQRNGLGKCVVQDLENRLVGRVKRILTSIYGESPAAKKFWHSLGYSFEIDAKPILDWYAKAL